MAILVEQKQHHPPSIRGLVSLSEITRFVIDLHCLRQGFKGYLREPTGPTARVAVQSVAIPLAARPSGSFDPVTPPHS